MSMGRIDLYDKNGRIKLGGWDSWFVYTAYARLDADVLIKVGVSTVPYERFVTIYCNCPFPIEFAAFTSVGKKRDALSAERQILEAFESHKTRGEWLRIPHTAEMKKQFARDSGKIIASVTGRPVKWQRANGAQIKAFMSAKMKDLAA